MQLLAKKTFTKRVAGRQTKHSITKLATSLA